MRISVTIRGLLRLHLYLSVINLYLLPLIRISSQMMACSGTVVCFEIGGEINRVFHGNYPQRFANYYELLFFWSYGSKPLRITEKRTIIACANLRTLVFIRIYTLAADFYRSSPILGLYQTIEHMC